MGRFVNLYAYSVICNSKWLGTFPTWTYPTDLHVMTMGHICIYKMSRCRAWGQPFFHPPGQLNVDFFGKNRCSWVVRLAHEWSWLRPWQIPADWGGNIGELKPGILQPFSQLCSLSCFFPGRQGVCRMKESSSNKQSKHVRILNEIWQFHQDHMGVETWWNMHFPGALVSGRMLAEKSSPCCMFRLLFFFCAGMYIQLQVRSTRSKCIWRIVLFLSRLDNSWVVGLFGHLWWSVNSCVLDFV